MDKPSLDEKETKINETVEQKTLLSHNEFKMSDIVAVFNPKWNK